MTSLIFALIVSASAQTFELPGRVPVKVAPSRLDWSMTDSATFRQAVSGLASQCESRIQTFLATKPVVAIIKEEGNLPGDANIAAMKPVKEGLEQVMNVAFCAYFAGTPAQREKSARVVGNYIKEWRNVFVGDGNPINDRFFISLMQAGDLIAPKMDAAEYGAFLSLIRTIDTKGYYFMAALTANDDRLKNNWMLHHIAIRTYANIILNNTTAVGQLWGYMQYIVQTQYTAPAGFTRSTCANLASVMGYGSYDLQQRDSLTYHAFGLSSIVPLLRLAPGMINEPSKSRLLTAVSTLLPYVLGHQSHPELQCTSVAYDKKRLALDASAGNAWNPDSAKVMFRHARLGFPTIGAWTGRYVTDAYHPWFKVYFTGKGDAL